MNDLKEKLDHLKIYPLRKKSVVLDSDLAAVYGVETRVFNQAFKRNQKRFPADFAFQLTAEEWEALRSQNVILKPSGTRAAPEVSSLGLHRTRRPYGRDYPQL